MRLKPKVATLRGALAAEMRSIREQRGVSQEKLAETCGLHRTYISLLERSLRSPTVDVLERIAIALGVRSSTLLARAERIVEGHKDE